MRWYIFFYINFTFSKIIEQLTVHFLFYNAWGIILQFNAKAHDIKWKLGPPCNESNFNLSPAILVLFLIDNPPRLFSLAPLLTIVTRVRTKHGPGVHGPILWTGSMDPLSWTGSMDSFFNNEKWTKTEIVQK